MRSESVASIDPAERLRSYIEAGGFSQGARLPAERHLTEQLGMSRTVLRRALEELEREGTIWRHVGKGTFLSDGEGKPAVDGKVELGRQLTPFRMMRARMVVEPALAREAAVNASGEVLMLMRRALDRMRAATTWNEYEEHDDRFHRLVAEASDNLLLVSLFDNLNEVRRLVAWGNVTRLSPHPSASHSSFAEHDSIAEAIINRDPTAAQDAMRQHLRSVSQRLFGDS